MKNIIIVVVFAFSSLCLVAQSKNTTYHGTKKTTHSKSKVASKHARPVTKSLPAGTVRRGGKVVPLYHGSHDYTPGSPIGTGGAGGGSLSGSPQGSASENAVGKKPSNEILKKDNGLQSKKKQSKSTNAATDSLHKKH